MRNWFIAGLGVLALAGCERREDVFGSNYDACILQNATRGGDEESRAKVTTICQRHFEEPWERGAAFDTAVTTTLQRDQAQFDGTFQDQIFLTVRNNERGTTISKMRASIAFYRARDAKGEPVDPITVLEWPSFDLEIGPGHYEETFLSFEGGKAPSTIFEASVTPDVVIPHGNPRR